MGLRERTKLVKELKARRCSRCGARLGRHDKRCKRCHDVQPRPRPKR